ncbi:dynein axonemal heavy chain 12 isoform 3-T4 [Menidia menidia]
MEFGGQGLEDDDDDDCDAATQFMIEQSLLESSKQKETPRDAAAQDDRSAKPKSEGIDEIFTAIKQGNEALLRQLCVGQKDGFLRTDARGWTPLHEAAAQTNPAVLELTFASGPGSAEGRTPEGQTPLYLAVERGLMENAAFLLAHGALPDAHDLEQDSPLFVGADVLSQAQDEASVLHEACALGDPALISLLLEHGADANVATHTGHMPIHRAAHHGHLQALRLLLPVTSKADVQDSGMSPLHSAAAGGHTDCIKALLDEGYDPNFMLDPWIRHSYHDERKSALFFAVSNNDLASTKLLLEAGAMANQDPIKCLQVALRFGNYELINLLLRHGANVNYYCQINTTHFPSALQYALKDEVVLRMLCNFGYDVERCFDCPYGNGSHIPEDFEGWTSSVIKDTMFCEVITVYWLKDLSGFVVRVLLDYVDHVTLCTKLKAALMDQKQWPDICAVLENARCLQHLCRLRIRRSLGRLRLRSPVFMSFLPLPQRLKDYVQYREYDLLGQKGHAEASKMA